MTDRLVRIWNERYVDRSRADLPWGGYTDVANLESLDRLEATARARLLVARSAMEIGERKALGATAGGILLLTLTRGLRAAAAAPNEALRS